MKVRAVLFNKDKKRLTWSEPVEVNSGLQQFGNPDVTQMVKEFISQDFDLNVGDTIVIEEVK